MDSDNDYDTNEQITDKDESIQEIEDNIQIDTLENTDSIIQENSPAVKIKANFVSPNH